MRVFGFYIMYNYVDFENADFRFWTDRENIIELIRLDYIFLTFKLI